MKKNILVIAIGLLLINGCSEKTITPKSVNSQAHKTAVSKAKETYTHKTTVQKKEVKQKKEWGAPTITEAEASRLYGFSINE